MTYSPPETPPPNATTGGKGEGFQHTNFERTQTFSLDKIGQEAAHSFNVTKKIPDTVN